MPYPTTLVCTLPYLGQAASVNDAHSWLRALATLGHQHPILHVPAAVSRPHATQWQGRSSCREPEHDAAGCRLLHCMKVKPLLCTAARACRS